MAKPVFYNKFYFFLKMHVEINIDIFDLENIEVDTILYKKKIIILMNAIKT